MFGGTGFFEAGLPFRLKARSRRSAKLSSNIGARSMGAETGRYLQNPKEIEERMAAAEKRWSGRVLTVQI